ncbi:TetR family transcriptional regulator [Kribbella sp. NBC_01505]|uniref:TetR/AcrR family transcriptional regulator n=1 Tax=Kribbella sp. NBC_01505 TaxID=2903580 RepID=UPI003865FC01
MVAKAGRPARLNRELIVAAALETGLDGLTMRELATRLDVSHSALYRWVGNQDELFDLVSEVMTARIIPTDEPTPDTWRFWLARLAWSMHDEFLAVPGYATRIATPHRHNPDSFNLLRTRVIGAFTIAGVAPELADQSWHIFAIGVTTYLAQLQSSHDHGPTQPRFDLYLDALLRGLPAQIPVTYQRSGTTPSEGGL